jgi:hypothetical protein
VAFKALNSSIPATLSGLLSGHFLLINMELHFTLSSSPPQGLCICSTLDWTAFPPAMTTFPEVTTIVILSTLICLACSWISQK